MPKSQYIWSFKKLWETLTNIELETLILFVIINTMENISVGIAFIGGVMSFFSPCVLPVLPGYVAYLAGVSPGENARLKIFMHSLTFVLGFSLIFVLLGASASLVGFFLRSHMRIIMKIAGVLVVVLGIHLTGIIRIPLLEREMRYSGPEGRNLGLSFLAGILFSVGWTPCISPILAGILTLAAQEETVLKGMLLLSFFSAGLGIPLILVGVSVGTAFQYLKVIKKHTRKVEVASGVLLIILGIILFVGRMNYIFRV